MDKTIQGQAAKDHLLHVRLIRHHFPMALASAAITWGVFSLVPGADAMFRLSMATAYASLALLCATLLIGPLKVWRRLPLVLSSDLRRDLGIWAGVVGLAHVLVGLQVHLGGRWWLYFLFGPGEAPGFWPLPLRIDLFGMANHLGLVAALLLLLLLLLSNDASMRGLGGRWWKRLQQLSYLLFALTAAHGILYQRVENRQRTYIIVLVALSVLVAAGQWWGWMQRRREMRGNSPGTLLAANHHETRRATR